jgi:hypothetical protein
MIYGKYDDSQYKEKKEVCPMCHEGIDDRDHLLHCRLTQHLWDIPTLEYSITPAEQLLYEQNNISSEQLTMIRRVVSDTISIDAFTRIGIFNQDQQNRILQSIESVYVDESIGRAMRHEIEFQLAPWIRAMTLAVRMRNASKYSLKQAVSEPTQKEKLIDYNVFDELSSQTSDDELVGDNS